MDLLRLGKHYPNARWSIEHDVKPIKLVSRALGYQPALGKPQPAGINQLISSIKPLKNQTKSATLSACHAPEIQLSPVIEK